MPVCTILYLFRTEIVTSTRVLELGSGVGFLGIVTAILQRLNQTMEEFRKSGSLYLTDINDEVLQRCHDNLNLPCSAYFTLILCFSIHVKSLDLSSSHPSVQYIKLDWSHSLDPDLSSDISTLIKERVSPEIVLGADVVWSSVPLFIDIQSLTERLLDL